MFGHQYLNADKSQQLVNYVEDYLECVESLPLDIQRNVSLLREIDAKYQGIVFTPFFCPRLQPSVTFFTSIPVRQGVWNGGAGTSPVSHFANIEQPMFKPTSINVWSKTWINKQVRHPPLCTYRTQRAPSMCVPDLNEGHELFLSRHSHENTVTTYKICHGKSLHQ